MGEVTEFDGHDLAQSHDCSTGGCPREGTRQGPGGRWFCTDCHRRIYAKRNETTIARHGTAGRGGIEKALAARPRSSETLDDLGRRVRREIRLIERNIGRDPVKVAGAKAELAETIRAVARRISELEREATDEAAA